MTNNRIQIFFFLKITLFQKENTLFIILNKSMIVIITILILIVIIIEFECICFKMFTIWLQDSIDFKIFNTFRFAGKYYDCNL